MVYEIRRENLGTGILHFPNFFVHDGQGLQGRWILILWENVHLPVEDEGDKFQHLPFLWSQTENLLLSFLAITFMADLQGAIFLNLFMNLETCSLPASTGKWTFSHKVRIQLPCQPWSLCKKNLESIKYQFLNSPLLFLTPYSNKYWSVLCFEFLF